MGKRESFLLSVCDRMFDKGCHDKPDMELIKKSGRFDEVCRVYRDLGGVLDEPIVNPGKWDIDLKTCIIELDEENHFNRYRLITLNAPIYQDCKNFNVERYKQYCKYYENKCPKTQKRWSTSSSDNQFGVSGEEGDFSGNGPSRWKQRAFYDYLKDLYSIIENVPVIRLSIYDQVHYSTLNQLIKNGDSIKIKEFLKLRLRH